MTNSFLTFINLVYPLLLACLVLTLQVFIKQAEDISKVQFSIFGIVNFESSFRKLWLIRLFLIVLAIVFFLLPAFRDYADLFPRHMQMEIFVDDEGIEDALEQFSAQEIKDANIADNWRDSKSEYIDSLNKFLIDVKHSFRFETERGAVRSKGDNSIEVRKVHGWSWQRYRIEKGKGNVTHVYETPADDPAMQLPQQVLSSRFELLETDDNYIQLALSDIYFRWKKVIQPEYKQIFRLSPDKELYSIHLSALTKVRFFPYVDIEKTLYLQRRKSDGKYLPIGYAIYYPD
jgi:hypothetical protein